MCGLDDNYNMKINHRKNYAFGTICTISFICDQQWNMQCTTLHPTELNSMEMQVGKVVSQISVTVWVDDLILCWALDVCSQLLLKYVRLTAKRKEKIGYLSECGVLLTRLKSTSGLDLSWLNRSWNCLLVIPIHNQRPHSIEFDLPTHSTFVFAERSILNCASFMIWLRLSV